MKKHAVLTVSCIFMVVFICGCLEDDKGDRGGKVITMTMEELMNDFDESIDNDTKKIKTWFKSLDKGDTLVISDVLNNITYFESDNITSVEMRSNPSPIYIEGNIAYIFKTGDDIRITMQVIEVTYVRQINEEVWTYEIETFKESWDRINNTSIPIHQKHITHA